VERVRAYFAGDFPEGEREYVAVMSRCCWRRPLVSRSLGCGCWPNGWGRSAPSGCNQILWGTQTAMDQQTSRCELLLHTPGSPSALHYSASSALLALSIAGLMSSPGPPPSRCLSLDPIAIAPRSSTAPRAWKNSRSDSRSPFAAVRFPSRPSRTATPQPIDRSQTYSPSPLRRTRRTRSPSYISPSPLFQQSPEGEGSKAPAPSLSRRPRERERVYFESAARLSLVESLEPDVLELDVHGEPCV
jgi:hypothetical protein